MWAVFETMEDGNGNGVSRAVGILINVLSPCLSARAHTEAERRSTHRLRPRDGLEEGQTILSSMVGEIHRWLFDVDNVGMDLIWRTHTIPLGTWSLAARPSSQDR